MGASKPRQYLIGTSQPSEDQSLSVFEVSGISEPKTGEDLTFLIRIFDLNENTFIKPIFLVRKHLPTFNKIVYTSKLLNGNDLWMKLFSKLNQVMRFIIKEKT